MMQSILFYLPSSKQNLETNASLKQLQDKQYTTEEIFSYTLNNDKVTSPITDNNNNDNPSSTNSNSNTEFALINPDPKYEMLVLSFFTTIIELELKLEQIKNKLTYQTDYIISNIYPLFDTEHKHYLNLLNFVEAFRLFDINIENEDVFKLIIKKYIPPDTSCDILSYEHFFEMLLPSLNTHYRDIIKQREDFKHKRFYTTTNDISRTTFYLLRNLLIITLDNEIQIENERKKMPSFILEYVYKFMLMKINNCASRSDAQTYCKKEDIKKYIMSNCVVLEDEFELLYKRMDKENKGVVELKDFRNLLCKSFVI